MRENKFSHTPFECNAVVHHQFLPESEKLFKNRDRNLDSENALKVVTLT